MELVDPANSVIIFLSQMILLRSLTFLPVSLTVTLRILLFWVSFFLLTVVFVLQWLSSIEKFWLCSCLSFLWLSFNLKRGYTIALHNLSLCFYWLGWPFFWSKGEGNLVTIMVGSLTTWISVVTINWLAQTKFLF